jgi:hypothetical protein
VLVALIVFVNPDNLELFPEVELAEGGSLMLVTPPNLTLLGVFTRLEGLLEVTPSIGTESSESFELLPSAMPFDNNSAPRLAPNFGSTCTGGVAVAIVKEEAFNNGFPLLGVSVTTMGIEEVLIMARLFGANPSSLESLVTSRNFLFGLPNSHWET